MLEQELLAILLLHELLLSPKLLRFVHVISADDLNVWRIFVEALARNSVHRVVAHSELASLLFIFGFATGLGALHLLGLRALHLFGLSTCHRFFHTRALGALGSQRQ